MRILEHVSKIDHFNLYIHHSQTPPNFFPPTTVREAINKLQANSSVILSYFSALMHSRKKKKEVRKSKKTRIMYRLKKFLPLK